MFLLHKRWLQFCMSELPFKAGLMTHPVVFHPLLFFLFASLSLSLCSFSMLWVWQIVTHVTLFLSFFGLMVGCAVQIPEKWVYQTHPAWRAWTGRLALSFSLLASTETCTTSYQSRLAQTPSNHCSQPIFETHNHHPNSNFLSCMETVLFIFPGSLCRWAEPLHIWPIRTLPHLGEGHQLLKWRTGRSLSLLASLLGVFLLVYACMCA